MNAELLARWLTDMAIYFANGVLSVGYVVIENAAQLVALGAAGLLAFTFDVLAQREMAFAPDRYRAGALPPVREPRSAQAMTAIALGLWLIAAALAGPPLPVIGATLWAAAPVVLLLMPQQRWSLLWTLKGYLILYSLAALGFRFLLWQAAAVSPAQVAGLFGGSEPAAVVLARNTGTLTTLGAWLLWAILPAGYFALFLQNLLAQPLSALHPGQQARDILTTLRSRGGARLEHEEEGPIP